MNAIPVAVQGLAVHLGGSRILDDVALSVASGESVAFLGANGSGKSTTIRCLLGLYHPDEGTVRVFGMDPSTSARDINRRVAYVPGEVALWPNLTGQQALDALAALRGRRDEARERDGIAQAVGRMRGMLAARLATERSNLTLISSRPVLRGPEAILESHRTALSQHVVAMRSCLERRLAAERQDLTRRARRWIADTRCSRRRRALSSPPRSR